MFMNQGIGQSGGPDSSRARLEALRKLLKQGSLSTQDELREKLEKLHFKVTQSTVSRDLRKLGAIRAVDAEGRTVYRLPDDAPLVTPSPGSLRDLVINIQSNGYMIVVHTTPGSASLVARHLDHVGTDELIGTLAGDDTIFVAPASIKEIRSAVQMIEGFLSQV